jgi:hypothetical protein
VDHVYLRWVYADPWLKVRIESAGSATLKYRIFQDRKTPILSGRRILPDADKLSTIPKAVKVRLKNDIVSGGWWWPMVVMEPPKPTELKIAKEYQPTFGGNLSP